MILPHLYLSRTLHSFKTLLHDSYITINTTCEPCDVHILYSPDTQHSQWPKFYTSYPLSNWYVQNLSHLNKQDVHVPLRSVSWVSQNENVCWLCNECIFLTPKLLPFSLLQNDSSNFFSYRWPWPWLGDLSSGSRHTIWSSPTLVQDNSFKISDFIPVLLHVWYR